MWSSGIARQTGGDAKPWTGGHAAKLRQIIKYLNKALKGQRDFLK